MTRRSSARRKALRSRAAHQLPRLRLQPFFEHLHGWSLAGMGIGSAVWRVDESGEARLLRELGRAWQTRTDVTCLDVGANEGDYTRLLLDAVDGHGRVHSFEPSAATFRELTEAIGVLGAHLHKLALGEVDGELEFHTIPGHSQLASLHPFSERSDTVSEVVQVRRLDTWAAEHHVERVDLLKIDVEGAELSVLDGASGLLTAGSVDVVQFEFGSRNLVAGSSLRSFYDRLDGFDVFRLLPDGLRPLGRYRSALEIPISATNYVAVRRGVELCSR